MIPPTIIIEEPTLAIAWQQLVRTVMRDGVILPTEYGQESKDVCAVTVIHHPFEEPMLHPDFPTKEKHLVEYVKQFSRDYPWKQQGFVYTYVNRLTHYPVANALMGKGSGEIDQLRYLKEQLMKPMTRRAQAITWVPSVDTKHDEPPCLQRIWMRKLSDTKVEMHCDWRSRDLFSAWNSNYIAILTMIKNEVLDPLGLKLVKLVDFCDSLHIYEADLDAANKIKMIACHPRLYMY